MSAVLYDVPGPRARRRVLVASIVTSVALAALLLVGLKRFADKGQFAADVWRPFTVWANIKFLLIGLWVTVRVALAAMVLSCLIGAVFALGRLSKSWFVRLPSVAYVQFFRAVPLLVLILFSAVALPKYGLKFQHLAIYLVLGLTVYNSAVIAEIIRAGILSVDRGQTEAALSVGLTERQAMRLVILPQAIRRMLPALLAQLVTILKDTSLGYVVSFEELLRRSVILGEFYGTVLPATLVVCAMYVVVCFALTRLAGRLAQREESHLGAATATAAVNEDQALLSARGR